MQASSATAGHRRSRSRCGASSPLAETAATLAADPTGVEGARGDPSLPAAAEALKNAGGAAGEPAPTF